MIIARWTTPGLTYTPQAVNADEIAEIALVIKQGDTTILEKDLSEATLSDGAFTWEFTQEETATLSANAIATVKIDYLTNNGKRFTTRTFTVNMANSAKDEVMA